MQMAAAAEAGGMSCALALPQPLLAAGCRRRQLCCPSICAATFSVPRHLLAGIRGHKNTRKASPANHLVWVNPGRFITKSRVMMNKSTTNRDIVECPEAGIVSRAELGSRVLVNGHFGGILRYLGPVGGRQGIFCGIELDQPLGKNDGTHQGVFYFDCRPSHGVFAPCHKVQLDGTGREKRTKRDQIREEPLSRSATAALGTASTTRNVQPPPSGGSAADKPSSQSAAMDWSLMSTGSTNSGCSLTRFDDDLMAYSQATYAVFESDCQMLSDLEFTDSTLLRLEEEDDVWSSRFSGTRQPRPDESVILDGPTLGFDLPVIGSPEPSADETPTPMAERTDFVTGLRSQESKMEKTGREKEEEEQDKRNRNHLGLDNLGRTDSGECPTAQQKHQHSPNNNEKARSPTGRRDRNNDAFNNNHNKTKAVTGILQEKTGKLIDRQQEEKKPKVSVFNSVPMPAQNLSAVARAKPKQPSKANIIMEQLKASIEAEKQRPKKEIRPKILIGKEGTEESEREGGGGKQTVEATSPTTEEMMHPKKNVQNTEAKPSVNKKPPSQQSTTTSTPATVNTHVSITLKKEKQRPTLSNNVSSSRSTSTASRSRLKQTPSATSSVSTPVHRPPAARQILSSRENTASTASAKTSTPGQQPTTAKSSTSSESVSTPSRTAVSKLGALFKGGRGNQPQKPVPKSIPPDNTKEELAKAREQLEKNRKLANVFIILSNHLSNQASTAERQIDVLQQLLEQKTAEFQLAMQKLEQTWQAKLQGTNAQHEHEIDQIRSQLLVAHKTEVDDIRQQHQAAIDELDRQLKLMKEEKEEQALKHEEELKASESERIRKLVNELESRNYELQLKGEELGKLRMENRALLLQADSIPEKDAQILKLGKKNDDLHESLNRVKQIERTLGTQLDHRKHEIEALRVKIMEIEKEKEILRYQLNDQSKQQIQPGQSFPNKIDLDGSIDASSAANVLVSSTPVSTRTPELRRKSTERPNSSCLSLGQNAAKIAEGDMSRSVDSALMSQSVLSCYRQEGHRAKLQNTPNKIYTPRDCYELNDPRPPAKRTVDFDLDTLEQVVNDSE